MKKIAIITLNGNFNYGNKLQNYALKKYIENISNYKIDTLWDIEYKKASPLKFLIKSLVRPKEFIRYYKFDKFNSNLNIKKMKYIDEYDKYIIGSDQVWNVSNKDYSYKKYFAKFAPSDKVISYAASIGINQIPKNEIESFIEGIKNVSEISVREEKARDIIQNLTDRKEIEVLIDPTLLLTAEEWGNIEKRPNKNIPKRYILNYFLGELSQKRKNEINRIAKENSCEVINLLDKKDKFFASGPEEFLWLEKNAYLICTDSFHSSVFALIFNKPFIIFNRDDNSGNMISRLDNLISIFNLKDRRYNNQTITSQNLNHDYSEAYEILRIEKEKSRKFFEKALNMKDSE